MWEVEGIVHFKTGSKSTDYNSAVAFEAFSSQPAVHCILSIGLPASHK